MNLKRGDICVLRRMVNGKQEILRIDDWLWQAWNGAFSYLG